MSCYLNDIARPLIVSRVKCGADLVETTQRYYHVREILYAINGLIKK